VQSSGRLTSSKSGGPTAAGDRLELVIRVGVPLTLTRPWRLGAIYGEVRAELCHGDTGADVINPLVSGESQDTRAGDPGRPEAPQG
jgi:hypothetical protein